MPDKVCPLSHSACKPDCAWFIPQKNVCAVLAIAMLLSLPNRS